MDTPNPEVSSTSRLRERLEIASRGAMTIYDGTTVLDLIHRGYTLNELHRFVVPRRTLARRIARGELLTIDENDSALRLVRLIDLADRVFGDPDKARRWLRKPNRGLDGIVPIDLLESETGAHIIEQALHQIDHGIYS